MSDSLTIRPARTLAEVPQELLELADPSPLRIAAYLREGTAHVLLYEGAIRGVIILQWIESEVLEIMNLAVAEEQQGKGFGTRLLRYAIEQAEELSARKLVIRTGNSSTHQLKLYQKMGFDMRRLERNFFLRNYPNPLYEDGIPCRHRITLEIYFPPH